MPDVPALRPENASIEDPVAELRAAVEAARAWLGDEGTLVLGNGSAKRTEKAPGYLDERAAAFDAVLGKALAAGDLDALRQTDRELAVDLWADVSALVELGGRDLRITDVRVDYDDAPYGVQYWVVRYECES